MDIRTGWKSILVATAFLVLGVSCAQPTPEVINMEVVVVKEVPVAVEVEKEELVEKAAPVPTEERYDVVLTSVGADKIQVIKVVRQLTNLGLREAKELVDGAPSVVLQDVSEEVAENAKAELEAAGARVELEAPGYVPPETEPEERYDVVLTSVGADKIQVIKIVRQLTNLGLRESKELVDGAPSVVLQDVSEEVAENAKAELEAAGARVELETPGYVPPETEPEERYDVVLTSAGADKPTVIEVVHDVTNLHHQRCQELVDGVPSTVLRGTCKEVAESAQAELEAAGATIELRTASAEEAHYDVVVASLGARPDDVIQILAELTSWELGYIVTWGWGPYDAPRVISQYVTREEAENAKAELEAAGATVQLEAAQCAPPESEPPVDAPFLMPIEDVFTIKDKGTVVTGRVERGTIQVGEDVHIVGGADIVEGEEDIAEAVRKRKTVVTGLEMLHKNLDVAQAGENVGVLLESVDRDHVERGMVLAEPGSIAAHTKFSGIVYVLRDDEGGRHTPFFNGYRPQFFFWTMDVTGTIALPEGVEMAMPGDVVSISVKLDEPVAVEEWQSFTIRDGGRIVGEGWVTQIPK